MIQYSLLNIILNLDYSFLRTSYFIPEMLTDPLPCRVYVCSGSIVVTAYDFESGHPGSNPEWGANIL